MLLTIRYLLAPLTPPVCSCIYVFSLSLQTQSPSSLGKTRISFDNDDNELADGGDPGAEGGGREAETATEEAETDKAVRLDNGIVSDTETSSHYR